MAPERSVFLITQDRVLAERLTEESLANPMLAGRAAARPYQLPIASRLEQARERLRSFFPAAILLDDSAVASGLPLARAVEELSAFAPVIVLAAPEHQAELAEMVAAGRVDVVVRSGDFSPVLLALIERQLRLAGEASGMLLPTSFLESLRHEVNNPLTGILGNAEMLLARREQLPAATAQRLETIAELALRVRESVRRLTWTWEGRVDTARTA
jgi:signal transduction histidine kinase